MIGYKKCEGMVLVTLRIDDDVATNVGRDGIVDARYAKYRAAKAFVLDIESLETGEHLDEAHSLRSIEYAPVCYKRNEWVFPDKYDPNPMTICGSGIHFFLERERAVQYLQYLIKDGIFTEWEDDGRVIFRCEYKSGVRVRMEKWFGKNSHAEFGCCNWTRHGSYKQWTDGELLVEGQYEYGNMSGVWRYRRTPKHGFKYTRWARGCQLPSVWSGRLRNTSESDGRGEKNNRDGRELIGMIESIYEGVY